MTHDANEKQQYKRIAQQSETFAKRRRLAFLLFFMNLCYTQHYNSDNRNQHINREQHAPTQSERRNGLSSTPHSNIRSEERGNRLTELSESKRTGQLLTRNDIREQRIQRNLHECVTNTQQ